MCTFRGILILLLALLFLPCCHFRLHSTPLGIDNGISEDGGNVRVRVRRETLASPGVAEGLKFLGTVLEISGRAGDLPEQRLGILWVSMTKCWYRILHRKSKAWGFHSAIFHRFLDWLGSQENLNSVTLTCLFASLFPHF